MLSKEDAAKRLGMALREVVSVDEVDGGHVVVTHDGQPTLITDDELVFGEEAIGHRLATGDQPPQAEDDLGDGGDTGDQVPAGGVDEVLRWVGDDRDKAGRALAVERARARGPRSGVSVPLEKLLTPVQEPPE